jgi:hypothetical protein
MMLLSKIIWNHRNMSCINLSTTVQDCTKALISAPTQRCKLSNLWMRFMFVQYNTMLYNLYDDAYFNIKTILFLFYSYTVSNAIYVEHGNYI